jgi:hypothetical protein
MNRRPLHRLVWSAALPFVCIAFLASSGCLSQSPKRVIVFVQAAGPSESEPGKPTVNQRIMERFVWPIFHALETTDQPFHLEIYPITASTASSGSFFTADITAGPERGIEKQQASARFLRLRSVLEHTYAAGQGQLVDVLGSLPIIDNALGTLPSKTLFGDAGTLDVIYVSTMIQSNGFDGYDFTGNNEGASLDACRNDLKTKIGPALAHRADFKRIRVLVLKPDMQALHREFGVEILPPPVNLPQIDAFWRQDVFSSLLPVADYRIDNSGAPTTTIESFLR